MSRVASAAGVVLLLAVAVGFAYLNGAEWVTLRLGFATLYRVPLPYVVFAALVVGMLVMFVAGIHGDIRVRRILRDRLAAEDREERAFYDRYQQELWDQPATAGESEEGPPEAAERSAGAPGSVGSVSPGEEAPPGVPDAGDAGDGGEDGDEPRREEDLTLPGID